MEVQTELAAALLAAQREFPEIEKDVSGGGGRKTYKYASLPAIFRVCLPILNKHGIIVLQPLHEGNLRTVLLHESGQFEVWDVPCSQEGLSPQDFGAKITYFRRYSFCSALGLTPDEDTDAAGVPPSGTWGPPAEVDKPKEDGPLLVENVDAEIEKNIEQGCELAGEDVYKQWHTDTLTKRFGVDSLEGLSGGVEKSKFCAYQRQWLSNNEKE